MHERRDLKRIVVIGCGLLGEAMVDEALETTNAELLVLSRSVPDRLLANPRVDARFGDVGSGDLPACVDDGDTVIACHGPATPRRPLADIGRLLDPVSRATSELVEVLSSRNALHLIFFSSGGAVYGPSTEPLAEDAPLSPATAYGAAKAGEEMALRLLSSLDGVEATALRCSTVYGARRGGFRSQGLVHHAIESLTAGKPVQLFGDGSARRGYLHTADLASVALAAAAVDGGSQVYNVCSGEYLSGRQVVDAVAAALGVESRVESVDVPDADVLLDTTLLRQSFQDLAFTPFVDGVATLLERLRR